MRHNAIHPTPLEKGSATESKVSRRSVELNAHRRLTHETLRNFKSSIQEARYGVVRNDMKVIVDVLNRLDYLADAVDDYLAHR